MTTLLLDTHTVHWWASEPHKLSSTATTALDSADELAVSAVTWYELAWLATHNRITISTPVRRWLEEMARDLRTIVITPAIADSAVALPASFPQDPADRVIYATAVEHGWRLVTRDERMRRHPQPSPVTLW